MSIKSFFKTLGVDLLKVVSIGDDVAAAAEPVIDLMFPAEATLYNGAVAEVGKLIASGQSAAAGVTGAIPTSEAIIAAVGPQLEAYAESIGASAPTQAQINAYTQALLAGLQVLQTLESGQAVPATIAAPATTAAAVVKTPAPAVGTKSGLAVA